MAARTILIVDDDNDLRQTLVEQLALYEEFRIIDADAATKGVQAARAGIVDLMIMDVGLPDMDGREAVRLLRKSGFKAPIIMLTGHDTDSDTITRKTSHSTSVPMYSSRARSFWSTKRVESCA